MLKKFVKDWQKNAYVIYELPTKTIITKDVSEGSLYSVMKVHAIVRLVCYGIYFLTLIPVGDDSESHYEELLTNERLNER